jgi:ADP-dependent NAD(P)H-hydrate dehydratase
VAVPEAFVVGLPTEQGELAVAGAGQVLDLAEGADAVLVGPGLGSPDVGCRLLEAVVPRLATRLVVDALGTGFVTRHPEGLVGLGPDALLTANTTELAELLGRDVEQVEADVHGAAVAAARMAGVTVLAGAAVSYVAQPSGDAWALPMGVPGAAVAGSGDVKAGAVAGLLARGADAAQAAVWGAYLHARSGERLAASVGRVGYLAREIARDLPAVLGEVEA